MFLTDFNFDDNEAKVVSSVEERRDKERLAYVPKMCQTERDFDGDANGRKATADLLFYRKKFDKSIEIYDELLDDKGVKGATIRRDIMESKARALCALGSYCDALEVAETILTSTPDHDDFRIVALALKIDILTEQQKSENTPVTARKLMVSLMRVLSMHPNLSSYWILLAKEYRATSPEYTLACLLLAKQFGSHIMEFGVGDMIQQLKCEHPGLDVGEDTASLPQDSNGCQQSQDHKGNEDFTDLGRSVRMKEIEETLSGSCFKVANSNQDSDQECQLFIQAFQEKWFKRG
eukprot:TRINITY_DN8831_c0_g1_i6.p1 TRINITY_DN8831_c0_g1~~TRINITY_DN8831_c0_g1_i6.p1  ORF type:complete len:292 (-),score=33.55 TRINITY_DN8831_c0_g1_i6:26-901(-)